MARLLRNKVGIMLGELFCLFRAMIMFTAKYGW